MVELCSALGILALLHSEAVKLRYLTCMSRLVLSRVGHGIASVYHTQCHPTEALEAGDLTNTRRGIIPSTTMTVMLECTTTDPGHVQEVDDTVRRAEDIHLPMVNQRFDSMEY